MATVIARESAASELTIELEPGKLYDAGQTLTLTLTLTLALTLTLTLALTLTLTLSAATHSEHPR